MHDPVCEFVALFDLRVRNIRQVKHARLCRHRQDRYGPARGLTGSVSRVDDHD